MPNFLKKSFLILLAVVGLHNLEEFLFAYKLRNTFLLSFSNFYSDAVIISTFLIIALLSFFYSLKNKNHSIFWILASISGLLINSFIHIVGGIIYLDYVPGVITSTFFVFPLTSYIVYCSLKEKLISRDKIVKLILASLLLMTTIISLSYLISILACRLK